MLKIFAPAKINLHLHVTGKRADNYHLLDSLVCFADVGDYLVFEPCRGFEFFVEGPFAKSLSGADLSSTPASSNTVVRAAWLLADSLARELNVKITLTKNLPPGSGIGGGSADAAACLWGLCQFWGLNLPDHHLGSIAAKIGSDITVCLKSLPIVMRATGNETVAAPDMPEMPALLIWPGAHASTIQVYQNLKMEKFSDRMEFKISYPSGKALTDHLGLFSRNDLESTARTLFPVVGEALTALQEFDTCLLPRMSGSGSSVFGIFSSETESNRAAEKISESHPNWWVRPCWLNRIARY